MLIVIIMRNYKICVYLKKFLSVTALLCRNFAIFLDTIFINRLFVVKYNKITLSFVKIIIHNFILCFNLGRTEQDFR